MKRRSIIILLLLFIMNTSAVAEHLFSSYAESSCASTQHLDEDLDLHDETHCEVHCDLHHAYLLPQESKLIVANIANALPMRKNDSYIFKANLEFFKPPIA